MTASPTKQLQLGPFFYHSEKFFVLGKWHYAWYFRPSDSPYWIQYQKPLSSKTLKADVVAFLSDTPAAQAYYQAKFLEMADVEAAEQKLAQAQRHAASFQDPEFDPGGSTNNPGKVARALKDAQDAKLFVKTAESNLAVAKKIRESLGS